MSYHYISRLSVESTLSGKDVTLIWERSILYEWIVLVEKENKNDKFFLNLIFSIKFYLLAIIASNHRALFIA